MQIDIDQSEHRKVLPADCKRSYIFILFYNLSKYNSCQMRNSMEVIDMKSCQQPVNHVDFRSIHADWQQIDSALIDDSPSYKYRYRIIIIQNTVKFIDIL